MKVTFLRYLAAYVRRQLGGILLLLASIVLSLAVVEGFLRLFPGVLPQEVQQQLRYDPNEQGVSHPYIGYLHTPNNALVISGRDFHTVHHTDGHGFRNAWPWPEKADIVVLGDSLVFGYGVEDDKAWPAILGQALPQLQIINLGLIGAGPERYFRVYETFGLQLRPQVLLVGLFVGNDFWDAGMFDRWLALGGEGNYMDWRDFGRGTAGRFNLWNPLASLQEFFSRNSYLYSLLRYARDVYRTWWSSEPRILWFTDGSQLQLRPSSLADKTIGAQPNHLEFRLVLQALERIQSIAKEHGSHVLVVFQPSKEEVYMPLLGEAAPDPGQPLRAALDKRGIAYLNLTPPFRQRAWAGERLFFEADGHPNASGYRLIAQEVLAHLQKEAITYGLEGIAVSPIE